LLDFFWAEKQGRGKEKNALSPDIQGGGRMNPIRNLLKIHLVAIDVAGEFAADFAVGFVDDGLHRLVVRQHLSGETASQLCLLDGHQHTQNRGHASYFAAQKTI
jgi:hypothetical protein